MKTTIEAIALFVLSSVLCSLTVLGAFGVDPTTITPHQEQQLANKNT
jgi:hypothetical protein